MFKFSSYSQSVSNNIKSSFQLYFEYGRYVLVWGLLLAIVLLIPFFVHIVYGRYLVAFMQASPQELAAGKVPPFLLMLVFIEHFVMIVLAALLFSMMLYHLYRLATNQSTGIKTVVSYIIVRFFRLVVVTFLILVVTLILGEFFLLPGLFGLVLFIFSYPFIVCENATLWTAIKGSVLLVWNEGPWQFIANLMRGFVMVYYPLLLMFAAVLILTWLSQWAMPIMRFLAHAIEPYTNPPAHFSLTYAVDQFIIRLLILTFITPLQAAALLVIFNDLKRRLSLS